MRDADPRPVQHELDVGCRALERGEGGGVGAALRLRTVGQLGLPPARRAGYHGSSLATRPRRRLPRSGHATVRPRLWSFIPHPAASGARSSRALPSALAGLDAARGEPAERDGRRVLPRERRPLLHHRVAAGAARARRRRAARLDAHRRDVPRVDRPGARAGDGAARCAATTAARRPGSIRTSTARSPTSATTSPRSSRPRGSSSRRRSSTSRRRTAPAAPVPDATDPVYRAYDNRRDANHRYTTDAPVRAAMLATGWVPEGYGPQAVVMCAPQAATSAADVALVGSDVLLDVARRIAAGRRRRRGRHASSDDAQRYVAAVHRDGRPPHRARPRERSARGLVLLRRVHGRRHRRGDATGDVLLQRRTRLGDGVAAPRLVRSEAPRDRRRRAPRRRGRSRWSTTPSRCST